MSEKQRPVAAVNVFILRLIPMLAIMAVIFWLSHQPGDQIELPSLPFVDKIAHAFMYGVLALSIVWIPRDTPSGKRALTVAALSVLVASLYGISDEWHQSFTPGREPSMGDLAADFCGALVASAVWLQRRTGGSLS